MKGQESVGYEKIMSIRIREDSLRRNACSTKQGKGQKVWFAIKSNTPEDSIDKDKH